MLALNSGFPQMVDICILASRLCEGVEIGAEKAARYLLKSILFDYFLTEQPHTCLHNKYCPRPIFRAKKYNVINKQTDTVALFSGH